VAPTKKNTTSAGTSTATAAAAAAAAVAGSGTASKLPADDAARIIAENAAAAAAARADLLKRTSPASGGFVQTDPVYPPATERCKLIRINRELKNQPTILGNSEAESSLYSLDDFHSVKDGRLYRSVLVEDTDSFRVTTTSFSRNNWCCIACSVSHAILPRKRNKGQWEGGRAVIFLADQCMPAILPTEDASCTAILRVEGGSLNEIGSFFCHTLSDLSLPPGSILLLGSLTNLMSEGLVMYTERVVNEVRRFNAMFKGAATVVPFAPPPLCGISDPETIRSLFDLTHWLDSTPGYCLTKYNAALRAMLSSLRPTAVFFPSRTFLPSTTSEFTKKFFERVGITLPGSISAISSDDEQKLVYPLLAELCTKFKLSMDTFPNLSLDLVVTPRLAHQEDDIPALFIGGSNADKLANAAASLGVLSDTITEGGWILSTSSVSIILPQVKAYCATLPP